MTGKQGRFCRHLSVCLSEQRRPRRCVNTPGRGRHLMRGTCVLKPNGHRARYGPGRCARCGRCEPEVEFAPGDGPNGKRYWCRPCVAAANRKRYEKVRAFIDPIKLVSGCVDCGFKAHPAALDFDHLPGHVKSFNLGSVNDILRRPRSEVLAEIAKCEVVCSNCHRIRTVTRGAPGSGRPRKELNAPAKVNPDWGQGRLL